jgi:hypothetical protein
MEEEKRGCHPNQSGCLEDSQKDEAIFAEVVPLKAWILPSSGRW